MDLKIKKRTFNFYTKKNYNYDNKYNIKKDYTKTPLDQIKEQLKDVTPVTFVTSGFFQLLIVVLLAFFILNSVGIFFSIQTNPQATSAPYTLQTWVAENQLIDELGFLRLVSYGQNKYSMAVKTTEPCNVEILNNPFSRTIYYLEYTSFESVDMEGKELFRDILQKRLKDKGILLKSITIDQLDEIDNELVIVVGSYPPLDFANGINNNILFIGNDITKYYNYALGQTDETTTPLVTKKNERRQTSGLILKESSYIVDAKEYYYSVVSVTDLENGFKLITLPATLKNWDSVEDTATDITQIIEEHKWTKTLSESLTKENELSLTNEIDNENSYYIIRNNGTIIASGRIRSQDHDLVNNEMQNVKITPQGLDGKNVIHIKIQTNINYDYAKGEGYSYQIYGPDNQIIKEHTISLANEKDFQVKLTNDFKPGDYLFKLIKHNGDGTKEVAAVHGLHIIQPYIQVISLVEENKYIIDVYNDNINNGNFNFENEPNVYIKPKGGEEKVVEDVEMKHDQIIADTYLGSGEYELIVDFGRGNGQENIRVSKTLNLKRKSIIDYLSDPFYLMILIVSVFIVALGIQFSRKDNPIFYLDIPDFAPISRITVPLKRIQIVNLIDQINKDYGWHYLPIKTEELQSGLLRLSYRGRAINATEHNIEKILDLLSSEDYVRSYKGHYGLQKWEEEMGMTIKDITHLRMLRDMFINNVIKFENFNKSKDYDTEIELGGEKYYIIVYKNPKQAIEQSMMNRNVNIILLFENEITKKRFISKLYSHSKEVLAFKLELNSESINLYTFDEFEQILKQFKK